jgi:hypothetical protein
MQAMPNDMSPRSKTGIFDIAELFAGDTTAWGIFEDRFGRVQRRFRVKLHGAWVDDVFELNEDFVYDDGEIDHRIWRLKRAGDARYIATSADCIGTAYVHCNATSIAMRYRFNLNVKSRSIAVDFDDRIYLIDQRTAMNRARISKWGVKLGEVTLVFSKSDPLGGRAAV